MMTLHYAAPRGGPGPTSEYEVQVEENWTSTFMLTESDANALGDRVEGDPVAPTISSLIPDTAEIGASLTSVTISGTDFEPDAVVSVDGAPVSGFVNSDTEIVFDIAAAVAGVKPVTVSNSGLASNSLDFTFTEPATEG